MVDERVRKGRRRVKCFDEVWKKIFLPASLLSARDQPDLGGAQEEVSDLHFKRVNI